MKLRRIFAALAACAIAATSVISASAADALMTKTGNTEDAVKYKVSFEGLTDDQIKSIAKIEANVSVNTDSVNGCIGYNSASAADPKNPWTSVKCEVKSDTAPASGTFVVEFTAGDLAVLDADGKISPSVEVQFWWVNPFYDAEGKEGDPGTATLNSVTFYDASGKAVVPSSGDGKKDGDKKDNSNKPTGASAGLALAGLALAGVAVVATKKSK